MMLQGAPSVVGSQPPRGALDVAVNGIVAGNRTNASCTYIRVHQCVCL